MADDIKYYSTCDNKVVIMADKSMVLDVRELKMGKKKAQVLISVDLPKEDN